MDEDLTLGLRGKVAIVTGAASGIGRATAQLLARHGALVVAEDIDASVGELAQAGSIATVTGDVGDPATAKAAVQCAVDTFGGVDIMINNAGRTLPKPFLELGQGDWEGLFNTNATGPFLHCQAAIPHMLERGGGAIVNVASILAVIAMPDLAAYAASKAAVLGMTRVLAVEFGTRNIRVNAVAPGTVQTKIFDHFVENSHDVLDSYGPAHPIGRVGEPDELANVIAFLASPRASFMTGSLVTADGGFTTL